MTTHSLIRLALPASVTLLIGCDAGRLVDPSYETAASFATATTHSDAGLATLITLPSLGGFAEARALDNSGTIIVGHAQERLGTLRAAKWTLQRDGSWAISALPQAAVATGATARGVSRKGVVAGSEFSASTAHVVLWQAAGGFTELGCADLGEGHAISADATVVAGVVRGVKPATAALWRPGSCRVDLPRLTADGWSRATALNGDATIAGGSAKGPPPDDSQPPPDDDLPPPDDDVPPPDDSEPPPDDSSPPPDDDAPPPDDGSPPPDDGSPPPDDSFPPPDDGQPPPDDSQPPPDDGFPPPDDSSPVRWRLSAGAWKIELLDQRRGSVLGANAAGDLVGYVWVACAQAGGCQRAMIWYAGGDSHDVGTLGGQTSVARGINAAGEVVGVTTTSRGERVPFFWSASLGMLQLPVQGDWAVASSISDVRADGSRLVVGTDALGRPIAWVVRNP